MSEVSGRGVGTSALLAEVLASGGRLEMVSDRGAGTRLTVLLPTEGWPLPDVLGSQEQVSTLQVG